MNEQVIWEVLIKEIGNPYGVAALMANLFAESSLNPLCITGSSVKGINGEQYIFSITKEQFINDGVAFGLAQWRYWSRKQGLWNYAGKERLGNIEAQLGYLIQELKTYKTVWNTVVNAKTIKEASDMILLKYEKPASVGESVKNKRVSYAQKYFDCFAKDILPVVKNGKRVITTSPRVFLRRGNGKEYRSITRIEKQGTEFKWVATAENGWHAVEYEVDGQKDILWISGGYSEVQS